MTAAAALAAAAAAPADPKSTERLVVMGVLLLIVVLGWLAMWRGWRRRAARQSALPGLPAAPADPGGAVAEAEGVYVSTTSAGQWLDRVVAQGLGLRSRATMTVTAAGIDFVREGAPDVFVPREALAGARLDRAIAGKVGRDEAILVVTWRLGEHTLDTGFRPRHAADREPLLAAVSRLVSEGSAS